MKAVQINLYTRSLNETYAIVSQLNYIAGKQDPALACASTIASAKKTDNTTATVMLSDLNKKQAVIALRDLINTYKCFRVTGDIRFNDPLTKKEIKLITLPLSVKTAQETLDKVNETYHLKLTLNELC